MIHSLSNGWTNSGLCACGLNFKSVNGILAWRRWFLQGSTTYALIYFGQSTWKDGDGSVAGLLNWYILFLVYYFSNNRKNAG
jgi:hypothetical protein